MLGVGDPFPCTPGLPLPPPHRVLLWLSGFPDAARRTAGAARGGQSLDASNVPVAMMSKFGADPVAEMQEAPMPAEMMSAFGLSSGADLLDHGLFVFSSSFFYYFV